MRTNQPAEIGLFAMFVHRIINISIAPINHLTCPDEDIREHVKSYLLSIHHLE
jgi:hypothetical protein